MAGGGQGPRHCKSAGEIRLELVHQYTILALRLPPAMLAMTRATILALRLLPAMLAFLPSAMIALLADDIH